MAKASAPAYFKYAPGGGSSPAHNLLIGEVVPGRVYEVPAELVGRFDGAPDWEAATKGDYVSQDN